MSTRIVLFGFGVEPGRPTLPMKMVRPSSWTLELRAYRGEPFQFQLGITIVDCWVPGHVLDVEIVGPTGERMAPGRRMLLPAGEKETGLVNVVKRLGFIPQKPGVHAVNVRLDRRWGGDIRFEVLDSRWLH